MLGGPAPRHDVNEVEVLERPDDAEHRGNADDRGERRKGDVAEEVPRSGPVDARGLVKVIGNHLDAGHEEHHVEPHVAPGDGEDERAKRKARIAQKPVLRRGESERPEELYDQSVGHGGHVHLLPHQGNHHAGQDHRGEIDGAEERAGEDASAQQRRQRERQGKLYHERQDEQDDVVGEGFPEDPVVDETDIIFETGEARGRHGVGGPVEEADDEGLKDGSDDERQVERERRGEEEPEGGTRGPWHEDSLLNPCDRLKRERSGKSSIPPSPRAPVDGITGGVGARDASAQRKG